MKLNKKVCLGQKNNIKLDKRARAEGGVLCSTASRRTRRTVTLTIYGGNPESRVIFEDVLCSLSPPLLPPASAFT